MLSSLFKLLGSTAFAQLLLIIISPVLTRLYSPSVFGEFLSIISIVYIINSIAQARMDIALLVAKNFDEIANIFSLAVLIIITVVSIVLVSLIILDMFYEVDCYYYMIPLMVLSLSTYQLIISLFLRREEINFIARNKVMQSISLGSGQILLGLVSANTFSLALAQSFSFLITTIFNYKKYTMFLRVVNPLILIRRYKNFIVYDTGSNFFQVSSNNLVPILITHLLGSYIGGLYYMAYRVLIMPVSIFSVSISQAISSKFLNGDSKKNWLDNNNKGMQLLIFIFFMPFALLAANIEYVVPIIFGPSWEETGSLIRYFSVWIFLRLIYDSFSIHFSLNIKSKEKLYLDIFLFLYMLTSFYVLILKDFNGIRFLILMGILNAFVYLLALYFLSLKNGFKFNSNLILSTICSLFIFFYPYISNFYISIFLFVFHIGICGYLYKKKARYFK